MGKKRNWSIEWKRSMMIHHKIYVGQVTFCLLTVGFSFKFYFISRTLQLTVNFILFSSFHSKNQNFLDSTVCPLRSRYWFIWFGNASSWPGFSCQLFFVCALWLATISWRYCRLSWWTSILLWTLWDGTTIVRLLLNNVDDLFVTFWDFLTEKRQVFRYNRYLTFLQQLLNRKDDRGNANHFKRMKLS